MRKIEKFKLNKSHLTLIIVASVLLLSLIGYLVAGAIAEKLKKPSSYVPPETLPGEDVYLGLTVAYPVVQEKDILAILVRNKTGIYDLTRPDDTGSFWLGYGEGDTIEDMVQYIPPIASLGDSFDYESLYAIEKNDGYGQIYLLTYLCSAIGSPYFTERIELPSADSEDGKLKRDNMLRDYGLHDDSEPTKVSFTYALRDSDGKKTGTENHYLTVGDRAISGSGFYYLVDGRDYIYYTSSNYFEYALKGFHTFINGMLVSEGLASDGTYGPYLTTSFIEWVREMHKSEDDKVVAGSHIVTKGDVTLPEATGAEYDPDGDGYEREGEQTLVFDLEKLKLHPDYERIVSLLVGKNVGVYYDDKTGEGEKLVLTILDDISLSDRGMLDFEKSDTLSYTYKIHSVESVLTSSGEIFTEGAKPTESDSVKISYSLYIGTQKQNKNDLHAVIALNSELITDEAREKIVQNGVGKLDTDITLTVGYTKDNSLKCKEKLVITAISAIYDKDGNVISEAVDGSYATIVYYVETDGVRGEDMTETVLVSSEGNMSARRRAISDAVKGKRVSANLALLAYNQTSYYEIFRGFSTYSISEIKYFVTSEEVVSFRFANPSERDPFYGESFFENRTEKNALYGLNAAVCETVVEVLGGTYLNTGSTASGFSGQTVALGLTPENMEKYGLYAYKIYFELPRGIYDASGNELEDGENPYNDKLAAFGWYSTRGFNLYISEEDPETGKRYVGSDMYDLIALVDGESLSFLNYDFVDLWARNNLVYTDIINVEDMRVEFNMEDVKGSYAFEISHKRFYITQNGLTYEYVEGASYDEEYRIKITQSGECMDTAYSELLKEYGYSYLSVTALYHYVMNNGEIMDLVGYDTVGVSNFKDMYEILARTTYDGILTKEEQAEAFNSEAIMSLRVKLSSSALYYNYDFYRASDRKIMVAVSRTDKDGNALSSAAPLSDFYISPLSFKKLVNAYIGILNGEELYEDVGYGD